MTADSSELNSEILSHKSFALVPAAGRSTRMGQAKLLMPWGDATLIEHVIGVWQASRATHVVVVVSRDDAKLVDICRKTGADVVAVDPRPPEMKDSVACGLAYVAERFAPTGGDVWLLAPADIPGLSAGVVDRLLAEHNADRPEILAPTVAGKRGHPVLFPWPLADEVPALAGDEGVNALVERHSPRPILCGDPGLQGDIDTLDDYRRLRNRHGLNEN